MKEAMFYEKRDNNKVKCNLCPNDCLINDGNIGFCGVRKNDNGKLYSMIYGQVSSLAIDPIEKKPLYHFYPKSYALSIGTVGCNMRCKHCQNWQIAHTDADRMRNYLRDTTPKQIVDTAINENAKGIAYTYNEPTIWLEYTLDCAKRAKENGLYNVYVTAGWIKKEPLDTILPYIDAFSLDIKGFSAEFYQKIANKKTFQPVLDAAINIKNKGKHLEIVTNIIPNYNDDYDQIDNMLKWIVKELGYDTPLHLTAFHPAHNLKDSYTTPMKTLEGLSKMAKDAGLHYVYLGNVLTERDSNTYCPDCGAELIKRNGFSVYKNNIVEGKCPNCNYKLKSYVE